MLEASPLARSPLVSVIRLAHPKGEPHVDPEEERADTVTINLVESGRFDLVAEGERFALGDGALFLTAPDRRVRYQHVSELPDDVCVSVTFDRALLGDQPLPARVVLTPTSRLLYLHGRLAASSSDPLALETRAAELFLSIRDSRPQAASTYRTRQLRWYAERIDAARQILEMARDGDAPSLAALGQAVGVSPFHLARLFRELVGVPPHRYLVELRLARAAALLDTGARVTEACHEAGFRDLPHFTRTFRRRFGVPPSLYRGR